MRMGIKKASIAAIDRELRALVVHRNRVYIGYK